MFKVTIKQYVKPLCALILIAAVLNSGCISTSSSNTAEDVPVERPIPAGSEIVQKITPDGLIFYEKAKLGDDGFRSSYDTDGDIDVRDSVVNQPMADQYDNSDIKKTIRGFFGIPTTSKLHQDYPNIEEFRIRKWDLDGDGHFLDKIEILINGEIVHTTTTDVDGKSGVNMLDAFLELGWW